MDLVSSIYLFLHDLDALDLLRSNEGYSHGIEKTFRMFCQDRMKQPNARWGAVVLDCFAGVGTALCVLKRLEIEIQKIIFVEHDKVARHVYRFNHDHTYNSSLPEDHGGINHVYEYEKWEDLDGSDEFLQDFLDKHGRKSTLEFLVASG